MNTSLHSLATFQISPLEVFSNASASRVSPWNLVVFGTSLVLSLFVHVNKAMKEGNTGWQFHWAALLYGGVSSLVLLVLWTPRILWHQLWVWHGLGAKERSSYLSCSPTRQVFLVLFLVLVSCPVIELVSNRNRKSYGCTNSQAQRFSSASQILLEKLQLGSFTDHWNMQFVSKQGPYRAVSWQSGSCSVWAAPSPPGVDPTWAQDTDSSVLGLECGLGPASFGGEQVHQFTPVWHANSIVSYTCHSLKKSEAVVPDQSRNFLGA